MLNTGVLPTFEEFNARIEFVLSDNGREFCGRPDKHPYELFVQLEEIEHRTTRVKRPHQGRSMNGRTPITVFKAGLPKPETSKEKENRRSAPAKPPPQKTQNQLAA